MVQNHGAVDIEDGRGGGEMDGRSRRSSATRLGILKAAEHVIATEGVSALTLERVAEQAAVSKGGLLYHYGSKKELVAALLDHSLNQTAGRLNALTDGDGPGAFARAYLDYVRTEDHTPKATAAGILASAALEDGELAPAAERFARWQRRLIDDDGNDPVIGLLVRIVGDGLWLVDLFDLAPPSVDERQALLDLVEQMLDDRIEQPS